MRVGNRLWASVAAAAVCVAAGSVLVSTASSAAPGSKARPAAKEAKWVDGRRLGRLVYGFNLVYGFDGGTLEGTIHNLTPYPWTLIDTCTIFCESRGMIWRSDLPKTLEPGASFVYRLEGDHTAPTTYKYNGWFTYRVDTLNHSEYLSLILDGAHCTGICTGYDGPALVPQVRNDTGPPRTNRHPVAFGSGTPNPEIGWTGSGYAGVWPGKQYPFDYTFQAKGDHTLDAAKAPSQVVRLLNAMCSGASGTTCSFTQIGAIRWEVLGDLDLQTSVKSCGAKPPSASQRVSATPPADAPDWHEVTVAGKRTRSVALGGSLTASTELNLFGVIDTEVSAKIGAEHEWADTRTFEKTTRLYVPQDWIAGVWVVAPVVGKVTGTLVVSTAVARYTITNFEETASGVSKDLTTPAFSIITFSRQMTADEYQRLCPKLGARPPAPAMVG